MENDPDRQEDHEIHDKQMVPSTFMLVLGDLPICRLTDGAIHFHEYILLHGPANLMETVDCVNGLAQILQGRLVVVAKSQFLSSC